MEKLEHQISECIGIKSQFPNKRMSKPYHLDYGSTRKPKINQEGGTLENNCFRTWWGFKPRTRGI